MSIGILLITHAKLGHSLLHAAGAILSARPERAEAIDVPGNLDPEAAFRQALEACRRLDSGDGVLVLTDLFGSTPSNIACRLTEHHNVLALSGVNLPMLVRALNYRTSPLDELGNKALQGARDGVVMTTHQEAS